MISSLLVFIINHEVKILKKYFYITFILIFGSNYQFLYYRFLTINFSFYIVLPHYLNPFILRNVIQLVNAKIISTQEITLKCL